LIAGVLAVALLISGAIIIGSIWRSQREARERLRHTLEQVLDTGEEPWEVASDWDRLEALLHREMEKDPEGELAVMAMRAYVDLKAKLHPFGLISNPPTVSIGHLVSDFSIVQRHFPGVKCLATAEIEASWDGGPWSTVGSCIVQQLPDSADSQSWRGEEIDVALRDIAPGGLLSPGPHRVDVRAKLSILQPVDAKVAPLDEHRAACKLYVCKLQPLSEFWPEGSAETPLYVEKRKLTSQVITLSEELPADFPRALTWDELPADFSPESWFDSLRARVVRARLPKGHSNAFTIDWPPGSIFRERGYSSCLCWEQVDSTVLAVGLEFFGKRWIYPPVPVAAEASFFVDGGTSPLLRFDFTAAEKAAARGWTSSSRHGHHQTWFEARELVDCEYDSDDLEDCDDARRTRLAPPPDTSSIEDGIVNGVLELVPSRRLALVDEEDPEPWLFYLGEILSIPLQVEIVTVPARRIDDEDCEEMRKACGW
jgi:hypothetical protein